MDKGPIVSAFIPESGTASAGEALGDSSKGERWFKASQKLGCGGREAGNEKVLDCMRSKPWKAVADAIKPEGSAASMGGIGDFGPAPDGKVVFSDYKARAAAGNFIKRVSFITAEEAMDALTRIFAVANARWQ
jgi:cholinesterase